MKKTMIRGTAVMLAVTMVAMQMNTKVTIAAKESTKVGKGIYTVTNEKKKEARFDKPAKKNVTSLTIPATVKIGKVKYKVVSVKANALKNNKKIKKLVIGKNVKKIGKKAFYNCKNLKSITIKSKKLASVGKKAFGRLNAKAVVTLPKMSDSKVEDYERMLRGGGLTGKNQVIKSNKPTVTDSSKKPVVIPDPEVRFAIGELEGGVKDCWVNTAVDATYDAGDSMRFTMWVKMPQEMYGSWASKNKKITGKYTRCSCGKCFDIDTSNYAIHVGQTGHGGYQIVSAIGQTVTLWYWTPDNTPCKVVYHATLPAGLTVNSDSIEVWRQSIEQISQTDGKYTVQVSGQDVTVTISDIKRDVYNDYSDNSVIFGTVVKFSAQLNEAAADVNQVNAGITYNCGGGDKTVNMNSVTIRKQ